MKKFVLLMMTFMLVLIGCSTNDGKDGKVTLRYSRWGTPEEIKGTQDIIDKFNSSHPNIEVKLEYADWENYWTKLQTQQAGGKAPDVFLLDSAFFIGTFAEKNAIQDLTPFVQKSNLDLNQFLPGLTNIHTYKEKLYALPRDLNSIIMFYNKSLFEKAKLDVPNGTWTWDQALQAALKLTVDKNGKTADQPDFDPKNIVQYGIFLNDQNVDNTVEPMMIQNGGHMFNGDYTGTTMATAESQQVLGFLHDLVNKYHVSPSSEMVANMGTPFATGKVAMTMDGSWMLPEYNKTQGFEWDVTLPPIYKKQALAVQSVGNAMAAKTKYPDQAWELIRYLSGEEAQKIMAKEGSSIPALKSIAESDFLQGAPTNRKAFLDATEFGISQPWFPGRAEVIDLMAQEFKSYMTNIKKLDEIVTKIDKDSQEKIKAGN
ncbi:ABC transporter substrate-binding protein [Paenibacillus albiflavus]|uniref:ABC transporter substrate-binding protein n=1 Tax=Paenibacillus albiflavus TaxID=2545760 RepID=A0A4R4EGQ9_9BACL|nr:ABC transporter substrate-binding protein [Paenibacillus albiflavus]TCZ78797.1 ABC transporter substrate-binding protein [Paenibacillus albiflavus]